LALVPRLSWGSPFERRPGFSPSITPSITRCYCRAISRSLTGVMRLRGGTGSWAVRCAAPVALLLNAISRDIPELPQDGLLFPE
jgi:hypothetical protein